MVDLVVGKETLAVLMSSTRALPVIVSPTQSVSRQREFQIKDLRVRVDVCAQEKVGCSLNLLTVWPTRPVEWDPKRTGEAIAARVTYLLEPLRLVEAVPQRGYLQVRSSEPWRNNGYVEYYEITADDPGDGHVGLSLARYRAKKGSRGRTAMPINLTWEALERLLNDLSSALFADSQ